MLNIDAVHYRYRRSRQASLQNVSLQVRPGTCCGLLGPNGAGKTTLISLIAGLLPVQQGSIQFAGQPLDAAKHFIVLPDGIGHGKSSKPSDGLRMKFPHYDYDDMVKADHRLLTEKLKVDHLRLVIDQQRAGA